MGTDDLFKRRRAERKARVHETRSLRPGSFLIVTEGEKTEPAYFRGLTKTLEKQTGSKVDIHTEGEGCHTVPLVERAAQIASKAGRHFEQVWVVFDKDDFTDFDEAIKLANSYNYQVAWSNQAFEFWLFLHFDYSDAALHRKDWADKLDAIFKERGIRASGYKKNLDNLYELVTKHGDEALAIRSARSLHKRFQDQGLKPSQSNPCTTVYQLVESIKGELDS